MRWRWGLRIVHGDEYVTQVCAKVLVGPRFSVSSGCRVAAHTPSAGLCIALCPGAGNTRPHALCMSRVVEVEHMAENLTPNRYPTRTTPVRHELPGLGIA